MSEIQAQQDKAVKRILSRWLQQSVSKCLVQWISWVKDRVLLRHTAGKIVLRLRNMCVSSAFDSWVLHTRQQQDFAVVLRRMSAGAVARAFNAWIAAQELAAAENDASAVALEHELSIRSERAQQGRLAPRTVETS